MDALEKLNSLFSPDQIAALKAAFLGQQVGPMDYRGGELGPQRDLNLRPSPTRKDQWGRIIPTPLFVWSAETPADYVNVQHEFPKLMWSTSKPHKEITVHDQTEQDRRLKSGYQLQYPSMAPLDPEDQARQLFESLSAEDQALLAQELATEKRNRIAALLATMADSDVDKLLTKKVRKSA